MTLMLYDKIYTINFYQENVSYMNLTWEKSLQMYDFLTFYYIL